MCLGVTVLTLPPTVACLGYFSWYQGSELCFVRQQQQQQLKLINYYNNSNNSKLLKLPRTQQSQSQPPQQSFLSYSIGTITLIGTYYVQSLLFPYLESSEAREKLKQHTLLERFHNPATTTAKTTPTSTYVPATAPISAYRQSLLQQQQNSFVKIVHQSQITGYQPPESIMEIMYKVTPPLVLRISATSLAFFCAGFIQTYANCLLHEN